VVQEVELLRGHFGGDVAWLRPKWMKLARYPHVLLGAHMLGALRSSDTTADVHHVYAPQLHRLPVLALLERPVVYTATAGIGPTIPPARSLRGLAAIVVPSRSDAEALRRHGLSNVHLVRSGIDLGRFADSQPPPGPGFVLLSGSAPWVSRQFRSKGVDALLEAACEMPDLHLVVLWRGVLHAELVDRVRKLGLEDRTEIINEHVDVSRVLRRVHAAIVLADRPGLVKAFPHSLLEALASGRPVIISAGISMAEYVDDTGCGAVVPSVDPTSLVRVIRRVRDDYASYRFRAIENGGRDFSHEQLVASYGEIYRAATSGGSADEGVN
jgi:glycosyltransferase involved in cell wall biosynthesis